MAAAMVNLDGKEIDEQKMCDDIKLDFFRISKTCLPQGWERFAGLSIKTKRS